MRLQILPLLLFSATLTAQTLVIEPSNPTSESRIVLTVKGIWRDGCVPADPRVTVQNSEIRMDLTSGGTDCANRDNYWLARGAASYLDPDLYRVRVYIDGTLYSRGSVHVTEDVPPFEIYIKAAPESGGIEASILTPLSFCYAQVCEPVTVKFGDVPATKIVPGNVYNWLIVTVPPHAAGAVDVTIANRSETLTLRKGFVYFSETGPSDYSLFEPLLFPLLLEADGAGGTHWKTEAILANESPQHDLITQRPLDATRYIPFQSYRVAKPALQYPRGYVWLPLRDSQLRASASLTVRETSRGSAFELPVVRESEFRTRVTLTGLPRDPRYRVTLRIYSLDDPDPFRHHPVQVFVSGLETTIPRGSRDITLGRAREEEPYFAIIPDLGAIPLNDLGVPDRMDASLRVTVSSSFQRLWAVASVIDNETQQSRIVTPLK